jgi:hypothetical protein
MQKRSVSTNPTAPLGMRALFWGGGFSLTVFPLLWPHYSVSQPAPARYCQRRRATGHAGT